MNALIPAPDTIPVAWGWFQVFLMLVFPLHLLLMNAMLGSTAISLYARIKGGETNLRLAHELAKVLPFLIAFTINLGVAALLFIQVLFGNFLYTSSVLMAVFWLSVPLLLIVAYYAVYIYDFRFASLGKGGTFLIGLALVILLGIAFFFSNNMSLMLEPPRWSAYFRNPGGTILNVGSAVIWPRYLHLVTGGLAVGGLFVALYGRFKGRHDTQLAARAAEVGMKVFISFTMVQFVIGSWFLLRLPRPVMLLFMGGNPAATTLFVIGMLLTVAVLGAGFRKKIVLSASLTFPLVFVMAFMRDAARGGYLKPFFTPDMLRVIPQYSPMFMFIVTLIGGIATIFWMLRKTVKLYK
ncbi:hypothetical protein [Geobacter sp. AOG2]|uniref:hypothetical protein n=1 Tax=Geobacter sp. AOG2 TaxID=1566347 RepID=UPI001CC7EC86|nr:hypothetical protein [Geobacter sp. AOG2]GFE60693.1 hypothetical protein AOG2_12810 [Geobacter sp. AOG2]